uniref:Uncharacterized protein n=1 Tax=Anguilla anguilla TaxID=7936 RepID=A0A0E9RD38_ANGAN
MSPVCSHCLHHLYLVLMRSLVDPMLLALELPIPFPAFSVKKFWSKTAVAEHYRLPV